MRDGERFVALHAICRRNGQSWRKDEDVFDQNEVTVGELCEEGGGVDELQNHTLFRFDHATGHFVLCLAAGITGFVRQKWGEPFCPLHPADYAAPIVLDDSANGELKLGNSTVFFRLAYLPRHW